MDTATAIPNALIVGLVFSLPIAYWSYRERWLTVSGMTVATLVGAFTFIGGLAPALALLLFFFSSTVLAMRTHTHTSVSPLVNEQYGPRDGAQVAAAGAVPALLSLVYASTGQMLYAWMAMAALGFSTADTWATSIGMTASGSPRLLGLGARVPQGLSGGMTLRGTAGALAGSALLGLFAGFVYRPHDLWPMVIVTLAGFVSSLLDSVLGATLQSRLKCVACGQITEQPVHCARPAERQRGFLSNWGVNVVCGVTAAGLVWLFLP